MRRLYVFVFLAFIFLPVGALALDNDYFPLDKGRALEYDDGAVERIVKFETFTLSSFQILDRDIEEKKEVIIHAFLFDLYNHEKRTFFRMENKIFEWSQNGRRLWYDFSANEGDSWPVNWKKIIETEEMSRNSRHNDISEGAVMTLVEKNITVKTPYGELADCFHFRLTREGVADAGYVDEWFAPGIGCVMRVWDTIAGPHQQRLVKVHSPEIEKQYRMDVRLDKEAYFEGENIEIEVSVLNWSDNDIILTFPTSLQADYFIDDVFAYSKSRAFTEAETNVVITARDIHKWTFTHTPEDYAVPPGKHVLTAMVTGTELAARQTFLVVAPSKELPGGIIVSAKLGKEEYLTGEPVDYRVIVSNETNSDIVLSIPDGEPVWYAIDDIIRVPVYDFRSPEYYDKTIPAGGEVVYEGTHCASNLMLKPGEYTMTLGLTGYEAEVEVPFRVMTDFALSDLSGVVVTPTEDKETFIPVEGAQVILIPTIPKEYERDLSNVPNSQQVKWATVTGSEGEFLLTDVSLGMFYILEIWKEGFEPYQRTLRTVGADAELKVVLKPRSSYPVTPLNFKKRELENLGVAFGTGKTIYEIDEPFKVFLKVHNPGESTVSFTFDSEEYLVIVIKDMDENILWSSTEKADKTANGAAFMVDIPPGETHLFEYEDTFEDKVPKEGGKYIIEGSLNFTSFNVENIDRREISGSVRIIATPPEARINEPKKFEAEAYEKEMVVDFKEDLKTSINMRMVNDDIAGEVNITELLQNFHKPKPNHRFVKMIEVDADSEIRENLGSAVIRIYYDEEEFGEEFDPEKLIIAHWHEQESLDSTEEPDWIELKSRVDTINKFVEAETENISSFALFEQEDSDVGIENAAPAAFMLKQNSPNPFNPITFIAFTLPRAEFVKLKVYNIMGQTVETLVERHMQAGAYNIMFDGSSYSSGVYLYRLMTPGYTATNKMLLIK